MKLNRDRRRETGEEEKLEETKRTQKRLTKEKGRGLGGDIMLTMQYFQLLHRFCLLACEITVLGTKS